MNKLFGSLLLLACLFMASCSQLDIMWKNTLNPPDGISTSLSGIQLRGENHSATVGLIGTDVSMSTAENMPNNVSYEDRKYYDDLIENPPRIGIFISIKF